jgi:hypothetical protein
MYLAAGSHVAYETHLFHAVEKGIRNVPAYSIVHGQPPREAGLIQVYQQSHSQVPQLHIFKVEAGAGRVKENRQSRDEKSQVAEARNTSDEGRCR